MSAATHVMPLGPTLRRAEEEANRRVKDKSYRRSPLGQEIGRYLRSLRWAGYPDTTLDSYEGTLARLAMRHDDFEGAQGFCTPVGPQYLRDFLEHYWGDSAATTKAQRTSAVRSFFAWALGEGIIQWSPAANIKAPRRSGGEERVAYAMPTLLQLVRAQPELRDQCALQLLCRMALRKNELRLLKIGDVDLVRNLLIVTGKGNKRVVLPLEFESLLSDLYLHVQGEGRESAEYLLYPRGHKHKPMDQATVHRWFKRCLERADLPDTIKPHEMRHSAADHLWRGTGNLVMAQELLRHSSPETTRRYLHPTRTDLANAMRRLEEDWG